MKKLNLLLIILFISAGLVKTQSVGSQTLYKSVQETFEFKFTTLNTEWLSCSNNAPTNDELQINNIVTVIKTMNSDIVALQEVGTSSTYTTIDTLVRRLGNEWGGKMIAAYSGNCEQNQGFIYKKAKIQLLNAALITNGGSSYDWSGGRFPVLYEVNLLLGGNVVPVSFINIHSKAMNDAESYTRRKNASIGLKALLDGTAYNTKKVVLLGDFNDYLNGTQCSTCTPNESPYKNFTDDTQNYKCLTTGLNDPAYSSPVIDNIIISNELFDNYKLYSTNREVAATQVIPNYTTTTSDHTPVSATFNITVGAPQCQNMAVSESFGQSLGNFTPQSVSGAQLWAWKQGYGAAMSGYVTSNNPNEAWLISPAFDLSDKSTASIAFNHALNFCPTESDKVANQSLWVSTNYNTGAPETATWTQLTIPIMPLGSGWVFVNSGNIKLPAQLMQNNVRFAFKYLSTTAVAGTWEIKDFTLNAECILSDVPTVATSPQNKVFVLDKQLTIRNTRLESVAVYDITGRTLFSAPKVLNTEIPIYQPGIYIVHVGNNVSKVIVK